MILAVLLEEQRQVCCGRVIPSAAINCSACSGGAALQPCTVPMTQSSCHRPPWSSEHYYHLRSGRGRRTALLHHGTHCRSDACGPAERLRTALSRTIGGNSPAARCCPRPFA